MVTLHVSKNTQYEKVVLPVLHTIEKENIIARIWDYDHTVWKPDPTEITNRLGWLGIVQEMESHLPDLLDFVSEVRQDQYTHVVLLGMGGSSLASDVFQRVFERKTGYLKLTILDSTDPDAVKSCLRSDDLPKTLFIVATKSGGTAETLSFFKYFYNRYAGMMDPENIGRHFIAITDPGSKLAVLAKNLSFRRTFLNDPNIGGRFSVLSYFGLVPAALLGVDIQELLLRARNMMEQCSASVPTLANPAVQLGGMLGALALQNVNKATFIASPAIAPFGDWVEQLIAESTGKEGKGILPVVDEPIGNVDDYSPDRVFILQNLQSETKNEVFVNDLVRADFPVISLILDDTYDLGALFFLWEMATAIAGYCLGIQPFDQPNVESAKQLARESINQFMETGRLEQADYAALDSESLSRFLTGVKTGDYVAIHAYLAPSSEMDNALTDLQLYIRDHYRIPVTKGYGPRFLHSTGQLHKGDGGNGLFIQLVSESESELPIPDEPGKQNSTMSFGVLKMAQALGDYKALRDVNRRVIRFLVSGNLPKAVRQVLV